MKLMSESIGALAKALVLAQSEMGNAIKDSKNPFFKSKYADLNSIREAVLPSLNKNGISVIQPTVIEDGKKFVQTMFIHESGEFISGLTEILSTKELDAQAQGSGISYARRYGLQSMANVGAEDDDGQAAVGKPYQAPVSASTPTKLENVAPQGTALGAVSGATKSEALIGKSEAAAPGRRSFRTAKTGSEDL